MLEYKVTGIVGTGTFNVEHLRSEPDAADEAAYHVTFLSAFDPAGLATCDYVDAQDALRLSLSGGNMNGPLGVHYPTENGHAANKRYVDDAVGLSAAALDDYLPLTGGTMQGPLGVETEPTADDHATAKTYVDNLAATNLALVWAQNYATEAYVDEAIADIDLDEGGGDYLPLSGGTVDGLLTVTFECGWCRQRIRIKCHGSTDA